MMNPKKLIKRCVLMREKGGLAALDGGH